MSQSLYEQLKKHGYEFKGKKVLAAFPLRVKHFSAMGKNFHNEWTKEEKVKKHHYTPVTKREALKLRDIIDPVTNKPYLKFAYVPLPKELTQRKQIVADEVEITAALFDNPTNVHKLGGENGLEVPELSEEDMQKDINPEPEDDGQFDAGEGEGEETEDGEESTEETTVDTTELTTEESGEEGPKDELTEAMTDGTSGDANTSVERAEWMDKEKKEIHKFITETLGVEMSWSKAQKMKKEELVEIIVG